VALQKSVRGEHEQHQCGQGMNLRGRFSSASFLQYHHGDAPVGLLPPSPREARGSRRAGAKRLGGSLALPNPEAASLSV